MLESATDFERRRVFFDSRSSPHPHPHMRLTHYYEDPATMTTGRRYVCKPPKPKSWVSKRNKLLWRI